MHTVQGQERNGKAAPRLEWQTCNSDAEWEITQQTTPVITTPHAAVISRPSWVLRHWRPAVALLMILTAIADWTWHIAQEGVTQIEADLQHSVELELWTTTAPGQEINKPSALTEIGAAHAGTQTVHLLAFTGETAIVQLVTQPGADQPSLRQTRFYRQTAEGWQHTEPDDELWGSPHSLESAHFIFHFRQNDAQVVSAVAPQMDDVYTELQRNFGIASDAEKLSIDVTVEHATGATPIPQWPNEPLVVSSPARYLAPVSLSDSDLLAQSIALPLIDYIGERAIEDHAIPSGWQPLLLGLRLWQLWDLDMPLARWRYDAVRALYTETPTEGPGQQSTLLESSSELCAMHRLWLLSPMMIGIPLECHITEEGSWVARRSLTEKPRPYLNRLETPLRGTYQYLKEDNFFFGPIGIINIATLLEYAVATYGHEQLPVLLASLSHYDEWETLIPAVFGVSASDFEAGWQHYLAQQYGVTLAS
ncbi:MAG: hypothetical protein IT328_21385 [Caldilineaceae bacterium]|nr:hypothetical protein [Caldilineaceae bacterium]